MLTFSGNDEGGRVGTEVEEELSDNVACKETVLADLVIAWSGLVCCSMITDFAINSPKPIMQNMIVRMMKPPSWIGLRPTVSTVATVTQ